jgi:Arc/MetJ-type ribon-helix-helix transcriptional regulator
MPYQFPADIEYLVQQQLATGYFATPDDVLRAALKQLQLEEDEVNAIQQSIDRLDSGEEGVAVEDAFQQLRQKYNLVDNA